MRTQEEILKRIERRKKHDFFNFETPYYIYALTYENAQKYLKPEFDGKDWKPSVEEDTRKEAIEYMPFAWEKANNCRGVSASRSISHYIAWLWLLGENFDDIEDYEYYGKPQLIRICEHFGLDHKQWDDGVRTNTDE